MVRMQPLAWIDKHNPTGANGLVTTLEDIDPVFHSWYRPLYREEDLLALLQPNRFQALMCEDAVEDKAKWPPDIRILYDLLMARDDKLCTRAAELIAVLYQQRQDSTADVARLLKEKHDQVWSGLGPKIG